jgi:transcriptional regulator with XRE-family HTH domain
MISQGRARRSPLPPPAVRRAIRVTAGVSQRDLAAALGVRSATICRYETGSRTPRAELRVRYARALAALPGLSLFRWVFPQFHKNRSLAEWKATYE